MVKFSQTEDWCWIYLCRNRNKYSHIISTEYTVTADSLSQDITHCSLVSHPTHHKISWRFLISRKFDKCRTSEPDLERIQPKKKARPVLSGLVLKPQLYTHGVVQCWMSSGGGVVALKEGGAETHSRQEKQHFYRKQTKCDTFLRVCVKGVCKTCF